MMYNFSFIDPSMFLPAILIIVLAILYGVVNAYMAVQNRHGNIATIADKEFIRNAIVGILAGILMLGSMLD